jgi:hypothetical protein
MKASGIHSELGVRARQALTTVLKQVSTIELKGMEMIPTVGREMDLIVRVCVLGRNHTLTCKISASSDPRAVRKALRELQENSAQVSGDAIPVFIAPSLSPEAQALCIENNSGFVDLEDNARLVMGEVFIGKRSLPRRDQQAQAAETMTVRKFSPARAAAPAAVSGMPAVTAA